MAPWEHPNHRSRAELPPSLRRVAVSPAVREWVWRSCGSRVVSVRRLPGASSTAVHAVSLADGRSLVLRRYVWPDFLADEPEAPDREVTALLHAAGADLPVPVVVASDSTGDAIGDGVPALLMGRVPGRALPSPDPAALATALADIHRCADGDFPYRYAPWCRATSTRAPAGSRDPELWEDALSVWRTGEPAYEPAFVHRDFHPGNVMWNRGRLSGVVDWANACVGPPGIDVATSRWNLADWAGMDAADAFVRSYEQISGRRHDPYWDIAKLVEDDWDLICAPDRVSQAEEFLALAMARV